MVDQHKSKKPGKGSKRDHIKAEIVDTEKGYLEGIQEVVSRGVVFNFVLMCGFLGATQGGGQCC